mmetsp:Transcript_7186/g.18060  ORF Transcript_7186/g.18060 Transcript_7186/m.18060 type:complete len:110 (+) Transcript_7186:268-597(+)
MEWDEIRRDESFVNVSFGIGWVQTGRRAAGQLCRHTDYDTTCVFIHLCTKYLFIGSALERTDTSAPNNAAERSGSRCTLRCVAFHFVRIRSLEDWNGIKRSETKRNEMK